VRKDRPEIEKKKRFSFFKMAPCYVISDILLVLKKEILTTLRIEEGRYTGVNLK